MFSNVETLKGKKLARFAVYAAISWSKIIHTKPLLCSKHNAADKAGPFLC